MTASTSLSRTGRDPLNDGRSDREGFGKHEIRSACFLLGGKSTTTIRTESVFPLRLDAVWKLLHAHLDDNRLREIHPRFLGGRTIREGDAVEFNGLSFPREKAAERIIKVGGRARRTAWNYVIEPPTRYAYEATFEDGSVMRLDNTYASEAGGTLVTTVGQFSIRRIPSFLATWIVKRSLTRSDQEDLAFARKMKF